MPYSPRSDSLAAHVIKFFSANPDEELTVNDIADKFDAFRGSVPTQLNPAVTAGMLLYERGAAGKVYRLGPKAPAINVSSSAAVRAPTLPLWPPTGPVDPLSVPLEQGVPIEGRSSRIGTADWSQLLKRMEPGHSCVLPKSKRSLVNKATAEIHKCGSAKFTSRVLPGGKEFRLWRVE